MKKIKVFTIKEVEAIVKDKVIASNCSNHLECHCETIMLEGYKVYPRSLRYKTFVEKGYVCACCGRVGTHYILEQHEDGSGNRKRAHFNLYSDDDVLMTKDHIIPKSKGGKTVIENMQTMCVICNKAKGNSMPE